MDFRRALSEFAESPSGWQRRLGLLSLIRTGRDTIDADALFGEFQRSRLGKADHGELAGDIDRHPRKADMAAGGGVIDDRTTTRPKHSRDFVLLGEQYAADVDVAYLIVLLGCQLAELALDASVIERDVQATEGCDGLFDECDDVIFPDNVGLHKQGASTGRRDLPGDLLALLNAGAGDNDVRPFFGKGQRSGIADAGGASRDKGSLLFGSFHTQQVLVVQDFD